MRPCGRRQASSAAAAGRSCPSASSAATRQVPTATRATTATGCTTDSPPACAAYSESWRSVTEEKWFLKKCFHVSRKGGQTLYYNGLRAWMRVAHVPRRFHQAFTQLFFDRGQSVARDAVNGTVEANEGIAFPGDDTVVGGRKR